MTKEICKIEGHLISHHNTDLNAVIDSWSCMLVDLQLFKEVVYDYAVCKYAPLNDVKVWVVDTSKAQNVFRKEIQAFVASTVAPKCAEIGIKYFFVILPSRALGKLSARRISKINSLQKGMQTFEVASLDEVLNILNESKNLL